jgi:hypothetical protein
MKLPIKVTLFYVPSQTDVDADITELTDSLIERRMGGTWWDDPALDAELASREIDKFWDWKELKIERAESVVGFPEIGRGKTLSARRLAVVTEDGAVQGAMLVSNEPVKCERDPGQLALFVELLFAAPRNRQWIRLDRAEQFRGIGLGLLRTAAQLSLGAGCDGRLKLESSPDFVDWYRKRGLLEVSTDRMLHEGVEYTPMELPTKHVSILLPERKKGK